MAKQLGGRRAEVAGEQSSPEAEREVIQVRAEFGQVNHASRWAGCRAAGVQMSGVSREPHRYRLRLPARSAWLGHDGVVAQLAAHERAGSLRRIEVALGDQLLVRSSNRRA